MKKILGKLVLCMSLNTELTSHSSVNPHFNCYIFVISVLQKAFLLTLTFFPSFNSSFLITFGYAWTVVLHSSYSMFLLSTSTRSFFVAGVLHWANGAIYHVWFVWSSVLFMRLSLMISQLFRTPLVFIHYFISLQRNIPACNTYQWTE